VKLTLSPSQMYVWTRALSYILTLKYHEYIILPFDNVNFIDKACSNLVGLHEFTIIFCLKSKVFAELRRTNYQCMLFIN